MTVVILPDGQVRMSSDNNIAWNEQWQTDKERLSQVFEDEDGRWIVWFLHKTEPEPDRFTSRDAAVAYEQDVVEEMLKGGAPCLY